MKKFYNLMWLATPLLFSSCEAISGSDKVWDISPVNITIMVLNSDGDNLLDEDFEGNILDQEIKITYDGEEYLLGQEEALFSRAYMPQFHGLQLYTTDVYGNKSCRLCFGEFEGADSYTLTALLDLGDGIEEEVGFIRDFKWKFNGDPKCKTTHTHNGEKCDPIIVIER